MTLPDRFTAKVAIQPNGCWLWTAYVDRAGGYAKFSWQGRFVWAHRVAYELATGPIPAGLEIDHLCRNRACVNPAHLEAVTPKENIRRSAVPIVTAARARSTCIRGHTRPLRKRCRTCALVVERASRARRRERVSS